MQCEGALIRAVEAAGFGFPVETKAQAVLVGHSAAKE